MADASNEAPRPSDEEDDNTELLLAVATGILKTNAIRKLKLEYDKKVRKEKKKKYPNWIILRDQERMQGKTVGFH